MSSNVKSARAKEAMMHSSGQLADRGCVPGEENGSKTHHYMDELSLYT